MSRCLLHKTKLDAFKEWLTTEGIVHRPGRGEYQVLQVALPRNQWGVIYDRIEAPEHYTVVGPLEHTVRRFIRTRATLERQPLELRRIAQLLVQAGAKVGDEPGEWHLDFVRLIEREHGIGVQEDQRG